FAVRARDLGDARAEDDVGGLGPGLADGLVSAAQRVLVVQLMKVALGLVADGRFDDVFRRRIRNSSRPSHRELLDREVPDLLIIWKQILLTDTFTEGFEEPFSQIGRIRVQLLVLVIDEAVETLKIVLERQSLQIIFERVTDEALLERDAVLSFARMNVVFQAANHEAEDFLVARKHDVRAIIEGEPIDGEAARVSSHVIGGFEELGRLVEK